MGEFGYIGSRGRTHKASDAGDERFAWAPLEPLHAVTVTGRAACGALDLIVFPDAGAWSSRSITSQRCRSCVAAVAEAGECTIEVRNVAMGLDIEALVSGPIVPATLDDLGRRLHRLASRQPRRLVVDVSEADLSPGVTAGVVATFADLRVVLAEVGGTLHVEGAPHDVADALPLSLIHQ